MNEAKVSKFNEEFYKITTELSAKVGRAIGTFEKTRDEKALSETLTFSLGSEYFYKMADLCFEIINALKVELSVQLPTEFDED